MDLPLFVISLINLSCCCIVTTACVFKLIYFPVIKESYIEEELERHVKATGLFYIVELVTAIIMTSVDINALLPLILLIIGILSTGITTYYNCKVFDLHSVENEDKLHKSNIVRVIIWFARFVCVFAFIVSLV